MNGDDGVSIDKARRRMRAKIRQTVRYSRTKTRNVQVDKAAEDLVERFGPRQVPDTIPGWALWDTIRAHDITQQ